MRSEDRLREPSATAEVEGEVERWGKALRVREARAERAKLPREIIRRDSVQ
jgi:hypothetical protein